MTEELKKKILYSDLIVDLITTTKVYCIYLGGSRLLNLETPTSDYDIILVTDDATLYNYNKKCIPLEDLKVHIHIQSLQKIIQLIKNPTKPSDFHTTLALIDLLSDKYFLYKSPKFTNLEQSLLKYKEALMCLALEKKVNFLYHRILNPAISYAKVHYHFLLSYLMLDNFKKTKQAVLTEDQKKSLINFKQQRLITPLFTDRYYKFKPGYYLSINYNYSPVYKEVKKYE